MKERPILMNGAMVRAVLEDRKTQTRRIWKLPPLAELDLIEGGEEKGQLIPKDPKLRGWYSVDEVACPYGQPGDRLWVREAWRIGAWNKDDGTVAIDYIADGFARREWLGVPLDERDMFTRLWIQSTDDAINAGLKTDSNGKYYWEAGQSPCRIRPSIHMPRYASRILLEITDVRVERLHDINESDAIAEGITENNVPPQVNQSFRFPIPGTSYVADTAQDAYRGLWKIINGPGSWDANPWVWVIIFKVVKP